MLGFAINLDVNLDDGSCSNPIIIGCVNDAFLEYNPEANAIDTAYCDTEKIEGCMSEWATNYDALANFDDGQCELQGCTSQWADNYIENATDDDGSCYKEGCIFDLATNNNTLDTKDNE